MNKIIVLLRRLFMLFRSFFNSYVEPALLVTTQINEVVKNPGLDLVVALTPTKIDDAILAAARKYLPKIIKGFGLVKIAKNQEPEDIIKAFIETLRKMPVNTQNALLLKTASLLTKEMAEENGKPIEEHEADLLVQAHYNHKRNNFHVEYENKA